MSTHEDVAGLVERLRSAKIFSPRHRKTLNAAADTLERQSRELEHLRHHCEALEGQQSALFRKNAEMREAIERSMRDWLSDQTGAISRGGLHSMSTGAFRNGYRRALAEAESSLLCMLRASHGDAEQSAASEPRESNREHFARLGSVIDALDMTPDTPQPAPAAGGSEALRNAIAELLTAVRWWAAQEDGIPEEVWPAYTNGCAMLGWAIDGTLATTPPDTRGSEGERDEDIAALRAVDALVDIYAASDEPMTPRATALAETVRWHVARWSQEIAEWDEAQPAPAAGESDEEGTARDAVEPVLLDADYLAWYHSEYPNGDLDHARELLPTLPEVTDPVSRGWRQDLFDAVLSDDEEPPCYCKRGVYTPSADCPRHMHPQPAPAAEGSEALREPLHIMDYKHAQQMAAEVERAARRGVGRNMVSTGWLAVVADLMRYFATTPPDTPQPATLLTGHIVAGEHRADGSVSVRITADDCRSPITIGQLCTVVSLAARTQEQSE